MSNNTRSFLYLSQFFLALIVVTGCTASVPVYPEPDPQQVATARLRISIVPGVHAQVELRPNNDQKNCLLGAEKAVAFPLNINVSGFGGDGKKKIGMPLADSYYGKIGNEVYIPVSGDLTIDASYSANNGYGTIWCYQAFRFRPLQNKDYELTLIPSGACPLDFQEIQHQQKDSGTAYKLTPVDYIPVAVNGSPAWKKFCQPKRCKRWGQVLH